MAKVLLKNTREQELNLVVGEEIVKVPAGAQVPNVGFAPGTAYAEEAFVKEAKKHPVVKAWFDMGWLNQSKAAAEPAAEPAAE